MYIYTYIFCIISFSTNKVSMPPSLLTPNQYGKRDCASTCFTYDCMSRSRCCRAKASCQRAMAPGNFLADETESLGFNV